MSLENVVYDSLELKSMIKKLKMNKNELLSEQQSLQKELNILSSEYLIKKQNVISLEIDDEIKLFESDDTITLDKKFYDLEKKLELQILNPEIKLLLPKLEQDAIYWEQQMYEIEKQTKKAIDNVSQLPIHLTKSTKELEEYYNILLDKKQKLHSKIKLILFFIFH